MKPLESSGAPPHPPDVSLRGAKRRGNLGKALPIYTECRRTQSLSNLTVAALSERHGGLQYAPHCPMAQGYQICHCEEAAGRRGNLAVPDQITGKPSAKTQLPSRDCHVASLLAMTRQVVPWCISALLRLNCLVPGAQGAPLQSNLIAIAFGGTLCISAVPSRDCTPRALPRASRSGRHGPFGASQ